METTLNVKEVVALIALVLGTPSFIIMCWNIANFAISARNDIKTLTVLVTKIEQRMEKEFVNLDERMTHLERKDAIRDDREAHWQANHSPSSTPQPSST